MSRPIEDYAAIGNCETMALVARDGSIDWLCAPRFDSEACFAALLGEAKNGRWLIAPHGTIAGVTRRYRGDTLILETQFETAEGAVSVIDFMARRPGVSDVLRIVKGRRGKVPMRIELVVRFGYGAIVPWVTHQEDGRLSPDPTACCSIPMCRFVARICARWASSMSKQARRWASA